MASNKVAVVTGANKGIGLAIVRNLCKSFSGDVILTARNESNGKKAVELLEKDGLHPKYHPLDISDKDSIQGLKKFLLQNYDGLNVLINNAGIAYKRDSTVPYEEQASVTNAVNYTDTMNVCESLLPVIKEGGRLVTVSSHLGHLDRFSPEIQSKLSSDTLTIPKLNNLIDSYISAVKSGCYKEKGWTNTAYGTSKAARIAMTRILARRQDVIDKKILVTCCCPGHVQTDMSSYGGPLTPDEGADTPCYLALLPEGDMSTHGKFILRRQEIEW